VSGELRSIVLASVSPRRLELLRSLGLEVEVVPSGYAEPALPEHRPRAAAQHHARAKLDAVRRRRRDHAIVAADTVVELDGVSLGKPVDAADAARMLGLLSGRTHYVHTAYALALPGLPSPIERSCTTEVRFNDLVPEEIAEYVASGEPMDKAGAYGIQNRAAALVSSIEGDYFTVVGFPLGDFIRTLRRSGFSLPRRSEP
jgi:septum formation protein